MPGSSVDGITAGNIAANSDATANPIASAVPTKAQPSRPDAVRDQAAGEGDRRGRRRRSPSRCRRGSPEPTEERDRQHARRPARARAPTGSPASRRSPVVFSARKIAPWATKTAMNARPPSSANGLSRSPSSPTYSWDASSGTPRTRFANVSPHRNAGTTDPIVINVSIRAAPDQVVALAAVLQRHPAQDQRHQDREQRQVEPAEQRRVPLRERRERRPAGHDQPHLVAVPDRPDRGDHRPPLGLVPAEHPQQHADPEVEALQHEVPGQQPRDSEEPDSRSSMTCSSVRERQRLLGRVIAASRARPARPSRPGRPGSSGTSASPRPPRGRRTAG